MDNTQWYVAVLSIRRCGEDMACMSMKLSGYVQIFSVFTCVAIFKNCKSCCKLVERIQPGFRHNISWDVYYKTVRLKQEAFCQLYFA